MQAEPGSRRPKLNPAKKMRPPTFDEAKLSLTSDQSVEVKLIY